MSGEEEPVSGTSVSVRDNAEEAVTQTDPSEPVSVSVDAGFARETSCRYRDHAKCEHLSGDALVPEDGHLNNRVGFGAELGEVSVPSASGVPDGRVAYVHPDGRGVYAVPGSDEAGNLLDLGFAEREEVVSVSDPVSVQSVSVSGDAPEGQVSVTSVSVSEVQDAEAADAPVPDPSDTESEAEVADAQVPDPSEPVSGTSVSVSGDTSEVPVSGTSVSVSEEPETVDAGDPPSELGEGVAG